MKKRTKGKVIALLLGAASLFLLGGCSLGETYDEVLANRKLVAQVTYYSNGGEFEGTPDKKIMWYKEGAYALEVGKTNPYNGTAEIERKNYTFGGWYYAVLDEDGNPVLADEESGEYKLGEPVDFSVKLQKGDSWVLVADWIANVKVQIKLACPDKSAEIPVKVGEGEEAISYKHGDVVATRNYDRADKVDKPTQKQLPLAPFKLDGKGYTFVEYYADEACTQLAQWPIKKADEDVIVYAQYIVGDWTVVRNADDADDMFAEIRGGKKYWLYQDIDASGESFTAKTMFDGEIQGNGFKISNFKVTQSKITANSKVSAFGEIQASAVIENLILENWTMEYSLQSAPVEMYFAFTSIAEGATINNVKLSGTMQISKSESHIITNMANGYTACLYGGYASDEAYITATEGKGFVVVGEPQTFITINNL